MSEASEQWETLAPTEWPAIREAYGRVIPLTGKAPALGENWRTLDPTDADVAAWSRAAFNVGVPGGEVLFVDVDLVDPADRELGGIIRATFEKQLGATLARVRSNAANFALAYYQPDDPVKAKWTILVRDAAGATRSKVEVQTYGQYLLFAGVHPSGVLFTYEAPPGIGPHTDRHALPRVDKADMLQAVEALGGRLGAINLSLEVHRAGEDGSKTGVEDPRLMASDMVRLAQAIQGIPNETIASRAEWVSILHAIKGACGGDPGFFERVVLPWCLRWKGAAAPDVEAEAIRVWESIRDVKYGADRLEAIARQHGYKGNPLRNDLVAFPDKLADRDDSWLDPPAPKPQSDALAEDMGRGLDQRPTDDASMSDEFGKTRIVSRFLYDPTLGRSGLWRHYTGSLWQFAGSEGADRLRDILGRWIREQYASKLVSRCDGVERHLRAKRMTRPELFDADPRIVTRPDGATLFRNDGTFRHVPCAPEHLATRRTGVILGDPNKTAIFDRWLAGWSNDRPDVARSMEELLARGLAPEPQGQYVFNLTGNTRNGKSLYCTLARTLYGGYATNAAPASFSRKNIPHGQAHRSDLVAMIGRRIIIAVEPDETELDAELFKAMSGGDPIPVRLANSGDVQHPRFGTLWIVSNHALRFRRLDAALERRLFVVPFDQTFARDETVDAKMRAEFREWGPHILARLFKVAERTQGMVSQPDSVRRATEALLDELDAKRAVCRELFIADPAARTRSQVIVAAYRAAAPEDVRFDNDEAISRSLSETLAAMGATRTRWREGGENLRGFEGVRLRGWLD